MARPCTICLHVNRDRIDDALLRGTPNRATKSSVDRRHRHIGAAVGQVVQRHQSNLEARLGDDDLLGQ